MTQTYALAHCPYSYNFLWYGILRANSLREYVSVYFNDSCDKKDISTHIEKIRSRNVYSN